MEYVLFDSGLRGHPGRATRQEAEDAHRQFVELRQDRLEQLQRLLAKDGVDIEFVPSALQAINDWFLRHIETREPTESERRDDERVLQWRTDHAGARRLTAQTESLIVDIAIFLGELIIRAVPHLRWTLVTTPISDVSYQRTVISGFQNVRNKNYHIDLELAIAAYAHHATKEGEFERDRFVKMYEAALSRA
jgi:hypothetical protein